MRTRLAALAALLTLALVASPTAAVTRGGVDDAGEHPQVGQLLFYVPDAPNGLYPDNGGWFTCSGTLISSTVVVTAGHCAFAIGLDGESTTTEDNRTTADNWENGTGGNDVWMTFNEDLGPGADDDHWDGWPLSFDEDGDLVYATEAERYAARAAWANSNDFWVRATSYPHPEYNDNAFYIHDAGSIILDEAQPGPYATLPTAGYLNKYAGRRNNHTFEVVGYGLNASLKGGKIGIGGDERMKADVRLLNLTSNPKNTYMQLSNNPSTGGTCFGDSGGPTFDNTNSLLLVAVTSFGLSPNCTGIGGAYRIDQPDDLEFLADVLALAD
jgi:hypothetical protein